MSKINVHWRYNRELWFCSVVDDNPTDCISLKTHRFRMCVGPAPNDYWICEFWSVFLQNILCSNMNDLKMTFVDNCWYFAYCALHINFSQGNKKSKHIRKTIDKIFFYLKMHLTKRQLIAIYHLTLSYINIHSNVVVSRFVPLIWFNWYKLV